MSKRICEQIDFDDEELPFLLKDELDIYFQKKIQVIRELMYTNQYVESDYDLYKLNCWSQGKQHISQPLTRNI